MNFEIQAKTSLLGRQTLNSFKIPRCNADEKSSTNGNSFCFFLVLLFLQNFESLFVFRCQRRQRRHHSMYGFNVFLKKGINN